MKKSIAAIAPLSDYGIKGERRTKLRNVTVADNGSYGVLSSAEGPPPAHRGRKTSIKLSGCTVRDNGGGGVFASKIMIDNSLIAGNAETGVAGSTVSINSSTVEENGEHGVVSFGLVSSGLKVRVRNSTIRNNADFGVRENSGSSTSRRLKRFDVHGSTVTGNGRGGIFSSSSSKRVRVSATTATGNNTDARCGDSLVCGDFETALAPILAPDAVCGASYVRHSGFPGTN